MVGLEFRQRFRRPGTAPAIGAVSRFPARGLHGIAGRLALCY
jgi:hypothetical protein